MNRKKLGYHFSGDAQRVYRSFSRLAVEIEADARQLALPTPAFVRMGTHRGGCASLLGNVKLTPDLLFKMLAL